MLVRAARGDTGPMLHLRYQLAQSGWGSGVRLLVDVGHTRVGVEQERAGTEHQVIGFPTERTENVLDSQAKRQALALHREAYIDANAVTVVESVVLVLTEGADDRESYIKREWRLRDLTVLLLPEQQQMSDRVLDGCAERHAAGRAAQRDGITRCDGRRGKRVQLRTGHVDVLWDPVRIRIAEEQKLHGAGAQVGDRSR